MASSTHSPPKKRPKIDNYVRIGCNEGFVDDGELEFIVSLKELPYKSDQFSIGLVKWNLIVSKADEESKQKLSIELFKDKSDTSELSVSGKLRFIQNEFKSRKRRAGDPTEGYSEEYKVIFSNFINRYTFKKIPEFPASKSGIADCLYLTNGRLTISLSLKVHWLRKSQYPLIHFGANNPLSDVVINVRGIKFYVNKQFLSIYSDFFGGLFNSEFCEKGKHEIELKDIEPSIFHEFLKLIYPTGHLLRVSAIQEMLRVADMFLCPYVIAICEKRLLDADANMYSVKERIELADKYNLKELMGKLVRKLCTFEELKNIKGLTNLKAETLEIVIRKFQTVTETEPGERLKKIPTKKIKREVRGGRSRRSGR